MRGEAGEGEEPSSYLSPQGSAAFSAASGSSVDGSFPLYRFS